MADSYLTKPFEEWTRDDAIEAITAQRNADLGSESVDGETAYESNRRYIEEGDHWQEGDAWPMTHSDSTIRDAIRATAEPIFCSVDAVEKCVGRQVSGLLGTEPSILIAPVEPAGADGQPSEAQVKEAAEMQRALSVWWNRVQLWERMKDAARRAAWSRRGPLRLRFLPNAVVNVTRDGEEGPLESTELADDLTFAEALERIHLSAPLPDAALLYTDELTQRTASIITYADDQDNTVAELWYTDADGKTVKRILGEDEDREEPVEGAHLPLAEIRGPLLLTDSVRRQQRRRDYFETILTRGVEAFGYRERYTTGAMPAGYWSTAKPSDGLWLDTRIGDNGQTEYLLPVPRIMGNGILTELQPRIITQEDGKKTFSTVGVHVIDPADPQFAISAATHAQFTILESCDQLHVLEGDKAVSGYSKKQSRFNFTQRLKSYKGSAENALVAILEGAIANADLMTKAGDPMKGFLERFRLSVTLKIDTGPLSAEEVEEEMTSAERLFKSRSTVQALIGVEDTSAENAAILADPIQQLDVMKKRGEVLTAWSTATNLEAGLVAAGVESGLAAKARRTDDIPPEQ